MPNHFPVLLTKEINEKSIPLKELWDGFNPLGVRDGVFVVFRGFIDESYNAQDQNLFAMSCLTANGKDWYEMERAWKLQLKAVNNKLKKEGRPLISRYHASDCSGRRGEFEGWTHEERDSFVLGLFGIFKRTPVHVVAYVMELDDLCEVFPEWAKDRLETAYAVLPKLIMNTIGDDYRNMARGRPFKITLFHDRTGGDGTYDPTILRSFNSQMLDLNFPYKEHFNTITAWGWEDCIALQPADLVAFECFKEAQAKLEARKSRRSFEALLNMDAFGIHVKLFTREALQKFREHIERVKKT
jgi:hypothetical protein